MKEQILIDALEEIFDVCRTHESMQAADLCEMISDKALRQFHSTGKEKGLKWVRVEDRPLFTKDKDDCWTLTDDGEKEFLAAVPYSDSTRPDKKNLWWIRHCVIDDGGLSIVGDVDNERAGWSLEDVTHYMFLPKPPGDESIELRDREELTEGLRLSRNEWMQGFEKAAELKEQMNAGLLLYSNQTATILKQEIEIERLKELITKIIPFAEVLCTKCLPGDYDLSVYDDIKQFKSTL